MRRFNKTVALGMALSMILFAGACGQAGGAAASSVPAGSSAPASSAAAASGDVLKGVYDIFLKDSTYTQYKGYLKNSEFTEKLNADSIEIAIKGTDGVEGTYTFPLKEGYISCEFASGDSFAPAFFSIILGSVGEYYGIPKGVFSGYINGLATLGIESKFYGVENKADGSMAMKVYAAEKPDMKELDEMVINDKALEFLGDHSSDTTSAFSTTFGKLVVNASRNPELGSLAFAIGEYDKNTDLTYKSIVNMVNIFKPKGYEAFLKDFTGLKDLSAKGYKVNSDYVDYSKHHDIELPEGYKFVFVSIGEPEDGE